MVNLRSVAEILDVTKVEIKGQVIWSLVKKVIQNNSGRWRLISTKQQVGELLKWTQVVATLLLPI